MESILVVVSILLIFGVCGLFLWLNRKRKRDIKDRIKETIDLAKKYYWIAEENGNVKVVIENYFVVGLMTFDVNNGTLLNLLKQIRVHSIDYGNQVVMNNYFSIVHELGYNLGKLYKYKGSKISECQKKYLVIILQYEWDKMIEMVDKE
jgi:hypothetical protein